MTVFKINKILVPLDFSRASLKALDYAVAIAKKIHAEIILLNVTLSVYQTLDPEYFVIPQADINFYDDLVDQSKKHLKVLAEKLKRKGVGKISILCETGIVSKVIIETAELNGVDIIVMGTHGVSGVREFFIGSDTFRVIRDAKCPVLSVQRKNSTPAFGHILVPFTDRPHSREKVNYAIDFGLQFSSTLHILGIDDEFTKAHKRKIELEAVQIKAIARKFGVRCSVKIVSEKYIGETVLKFAQTLKSDLIISSDLDKTDISEYFTGPFAQQIVNHSTIPVLSIRPGFNTDTVDLRFY